MTIGIGIQEMGGRPVNQPAPSVVPAIAVGRRPSVLDTQYRLGTLWIVDEVGPAKGEVWLLTQFRGRTPIWQRLGVADPQQAISQVRTDEGTAAAAPDNSLTIRGDSELADSAHTISFQGHQDQIIARLKAAGSAYESHEHNAGACSFDKQSFCVDAKGFVRFKGDKISIRKIRDASGDEAGPDGLGILGIRGTSELFHGEHHSVPQCSEGDIVFKAKAAQESHEPIAKRAGVASFQDDHFDVKNGHVALKKGVVWGVQQVGCQTGQAEHAGGRMHLRGDKSLHTSGYGDTVSINVHRSTLEQAIDGADTGGLITPAVLRELFLRPHPLGSIKPAKVHATEVEAGTLLPTRDKLVGNWENPWKMVHTESITVGHKPWNTLTSYEVGYWVPQLEQTGVTYAYRRQDGRYRKLGELVEIQGIIEIESAKGNPLTPIYLVGLPYPVAADAHTEPDWTVDMLPRDSIGGRPRRGSIETEGIRSSIGGEQLIFVLQYGNKLIYKARYRTDVP